MEFFCERLEHDAEGVDHAVHDEAEHKSSKDYHPAVEKFAPLFFHHPSSICPSRQYVKTTAAVDTVRRGESSKENEEEENNTQIENQQVGFALELFTASLRA